jgi:hypothetical protein
MLSRSLSTIARRAFATEAVRCTGQCFNSAHAENSCALIFESNSWPTTPLPRSGCRPLAPLPQKLLRTPLFAFHNELGAKMVPFAGWEMPVQYPAGVLKEHFHTRSVRNQCFFSHFWLRGRPFLCLHCSPGLELRTRKIKPAA